MGHRSSPDARDAEAQSPAVQRLFEACRAHLCLPPEASREGHLQDVLHIMDRMTAEDVGLQAPLRDSKTAAEAVPCAAAQEQEERQQGHAPPPAARHRWGLGWRPGGPRPSPRARALQPVRYLHIYEDQFFSIGVFCIPQASFIPLHDHPGMSVLSRLLYGSLHIRAFDWHPAGKRYSGPNERRRLAEVATDGVFEGGPGSATRVLHPSSGGNIHAFHALSDCAILDVLSPPYAPWPGNRDCTYYAEEKAGPLPDAPGTSGPELYWLKPSQPPPSFCVQSGRYRGPQPITSASAVKCAAIFGGRRQFKLSQHFNLCGVLERCHLPFVSALR